MSKVTPKLCKAGIQLREQLDDSFPDRRRPDGWVADARHYRDNPRSDHIPDAEGWVRALDVSVHLGLGEQMHDLADQLRIHAKRGDKRISYIIFDGRICYYTKKSGCVASEVSLQSIFTKEIHHEICYDNIRLNRILKAVRYGYTFSARFWYYLLSSNILENKSKLM